MGGIETLRADHELSKFSCGRKTLDEFLRLHALANQNLDSSKTFVTCEGSRVIGYYTTTFSSIEAAKTPRSIAARMPRDYPIPVMVLGRLAVDAEFQGKDLGTALLKHALAGAVKASTLAGLKSVLVDAADEKAKSFYQRFEFEVSPHDPLCLHLSIQDIRYNFNLG